MKGDRMRVTWNRRSAAGLETMPIRRAARRIAMAARWLASGRAFARCRQLGADCGLRPTRPISRAWQQPSCGEPVAEGYARSQTARALGGRASNKADKEIVAKTASRTPIEREACRRCPKTTTSRAVGPAQGASVCATREVRGGIRHRALCRSDGRRLGAARRGGASAASGRLCGARRQGHRANW